MGQSRTGIDTVRRQRLDRQSRTWGNRGQALTRSAGKGWTGSRAAVADRHRHRRPRILDRHRHARILARILDRHRHAAGRGQDGWGRRRSWGDRGQASTSARSRVAADESVDRGQASTRPQASTSPNPRRRATRPGRPYPRPESSPIEADRSQGVRSRASPLADSAATCGDASVDLSPDAGAASSTSAK